jgi:hypothetical protein
MEGFTAVPEVARLESNPRSKNTQQPSIDRAEQPARKESALITDQWMQRKPSNENQWSSDPAPRGAGCLAARITPGGERRFYFRYTDQNRTQWRHSLGSYDKAGRDGLTLKHPAQAGVDQVLPSLDDLFFRLGGLEALRDADCGEVVHRALLAEKERRLGGLF